MYIVLRTKADRTCFSTIISKDIDQVHTVGGIKTVKFSSRTVLFKSKRVPIPFNRKMEMKWEMEHATDGAIEYVNHS